MSDLESDYGSDVMSDIDSSFGDDDSDRSAPDSASDFSEESAASDNEEDFAPSGFPPLSSLQTSGTTAAPSPFAFPPVVSAPGFTPAPGFPPVAAPPTSTFPQLSATAGSANAFPPMFATPNVGFPQAAPATSQMSFPQFNFAAPAQAAPSPFSFAPPSQPFPNIAAAPFVSPAVTGGFPAFAPAVPVVVPTPVLAPAQLPKNVKDAEEALKAFPTAYILGTTVVKPESTDIHSFLVQNSDESAEDFESRRRLSIIINTIPGLPLTAMTSVVVAYCMLKKSKLGNTYEPSVESAISYIYQAALSGSQSSSTTALSVATMPSTTMDNQGYGKLIQSSTNLLLSPAFNPLATTTPPAVPATVPASPVPSFVTPNAGFPQAGPGMGNLPAMMSPSLQSFPQATAVAPPTFTAAFLPAVTSPGLTAFPNLPPITPPITGLSALTATSTLPQQVVTTPTPPSNPTLSSTEVSNIISNVSSADAARLASPSPAQIMTLTPIPVIAPVGTTPPPSSFTTQ